MISKIVFVLSLLVLTESSHAENEVDLSGLHSFAEETSNETSNFKGSVGFDSSSFFYKSNIRGTSSTTLEAAFENRIDTPALHGEADLELFTFIDNQPLVSGEAHELYLANQKNTLGNFQISVGRKIEEWSKLDRTWTQMSLWSPRWTWDELHPEIVGMTGVFLSYNTPRFQLTAFGSPLAIPERGTPVSEKNGNIVSPNPFWKPLPTTLTVMGQPTALRYTLLTPPLQEILLRPNFALRARYEFQNGFWVSANSGVLPVNMIQMAAEPYLAASDNGVLQVNIRPQFPMRNINTVESGYQADDHEWDVWTSVSYEQPFNFENQSTWLNPIITPSSIVSAGTDIRLTRNFTFNGAALFIHEQPYVSASNLPNVNVNLPTRFPLKQGIKIGGNWRFSEVTDANAAWVQDLVEQNHLVTVDIQRHIRKMNITVGAGADVLFTNSTHGWVGQYYGADRLRGWLKYAF